MSYITIAESLFQIADLTKTYMRDELGLRNIKVEEQIDGKIGYKPTLAGEDRDHYRWCVDIVEEIETPTRESIIAELTHQNLPIKFCVSIQNSEGASLQVSSLRWASSRGVGVIAVDPSTQRIDIIKNPLALSLCSLRKFDKSTFPLRLRGIVKRAEDLFQGGEPNKSCSIVYDEIERMTRRLATITHSKNLWRQSLGNPEDIEVKSWTSLIGDLRAKLPRESSTNLEELTNQLLSRIDGITTHRNESGHSPSNYRKLKERDSRLRTRLETSVDILLELSKSTRKYRL